jgi:UDP-N-acetylmuramoylalanine--D-glutamate ligase
MFFAWIMIVMFGKWKVGNSVKRLLDLMGIDCILMDDSDCDFDILSSCESIVVTPGIKQSHSLYATYSQKIYSELNFLWKYIIPKIWFAFPPTWIWITATNGKSTTTWITYNILKWILPHDRVFITWNFDISLSDTLAEVIENNWLDQKCVFVIEASSFMLYKLNYFSFDYGILLNIAVDHLDWHKDWQEYRDSKLMLLKHIKHWWITSPEVYVYLDEESKSHTKIYDWNFDLQKTHFLGKHNQENLSAVYLLAKLYFEDITKQWDQNLFEFVLKQVQPLAHRLSLMDDVDGIKIYDDWICTSSHALNVAISSFDKKIVLIAWGYDKGEDYSRLSTVLQDHVWFAVLMWQTSDKFGNVCKKANVDFMVVGWLKDALNVAYTKAKNLWLGVILYSPWSASFDMFKNVYHRVEEFEKEVKIFVSRIIS